MNPPWDVFGVGAAVGGAVGIYGGYHLRKLVVRIQEWRDMRRNIDHQERKREQRKERHVETDQPANLPPVIPIRVKRSTPRTLEAVPQMSANPDRDEVIAALTGAGYSKTAASKAVDACSLVERASGPEHWTIAALRHAHGAK